MVIVKLNFEVYVKYSQTFMEILRGYTPQVEQYSIDEAFMDMTGTEGLYGDLIGIAHIIKDRIYKCQIFKTLSKYLTLINLKL